MAAIAGRSIPGNDLMTILDSASSAPVLPADTRPDASPRRDRIDRQAHGGLPAAQRRRRLHVVADDIGRMAHGARRARALMPAKQRRQRRLVTDQQKPRRGMTLGCNFQTLNDHIRGLVAPHGIHGQRERTGGTGGPSARRDPASGPDSAPQRLPGCNHFAPVVMATMAADVVGPLQLATVGAFRMRLVRQRLVAAAHAGAGRGGLSLRYGHGTAPLSNDVASRRVRGMTKIHDWTKTRAAPSSRATAPSQWLIV